MGQTVRSLHAGRRVSGRPLSPGIRGGRQPRVRLRGPRRMRVLLDSNILARLAQHTHPMHATSRDAVAALHRGGETPHTVPQNFYEFWTVAIRPTAVNGLGLTASEASAELVRLQTLFPILVDSPLLFVEWQKLVTTHDVLGKNAHDARLVAAMAI